MDCSDVEKLISGWIDGEITAEERTALEAHLAGCAECRSLEQALRAQDSSLLRAFLPRREAAAAVAERALASWQTEGAAAPQPTRRRLPASAWLALGVAAGFLLAILLFPPWKTASPGGDVAAVLPRESPIPITQARLVAATGRVEVRQPEEQEWRPLAPADQFSFAAGTAIRTGPRVRCEVQTSNGYVIRLNDETEVDMRSGQEVMLRQGQLWCSAPDDLSLRVRVADPVAEAQPPPQSTATELPSLPVLTCPSNASLMSAIRPDGKVQVMTAAGEVQVYTPTARERLEQGESATIVGGKIMKGTAGEDAVLAARWIHPLLMQKGLANEELSQRVDELLAHIGRSKLSTLYEQEIRSLGEYSVLPLLRFVQSPLSRHDQLKRITAMRILSDVAPSSTVSDLIGLLEDRDADVRFYAATALRRLTAHNQGREPEQWRNPWSDCTPTHARWQQWWERNKERYPPQLASNDRPLPNP